MTGVFKALVIVVAAVILFTAAGIVLGKLLAVLVVGAVILIGVIILCQIWTSKDHYREPPE